jgi:hypothetical protein
MLKPHLRVVLIMATAGTAWLSSCSVEDAPVAPEGVPEQQTGVRATPEDPPPNEFPAVERVAAQIRAVGPFRPGLPITVVAGGKANRPAETTNLKVLSLDEDLSGSAFARRPGLDRPLKSMAASLTPGAKVETTTQITFSSPGYYRVLAHVDASSNVAPVEGDSIILDQSDRTLWMLVDEKGGRLTEGWDPQAFAGQQPKFGAYGPFISPDSTDAEDGVTSALAADAEDGVASALATTYTYSGRITYLNRPIDRRDPVPNTRMEFSCGYPSGTGIIYEGALISTNANGNWSGSCLLSRPYVRIALHAFRDNYSSVAGKDGASAGFQILAQNGGTFPDLRVGNDDAAVTFIKLSRRVPQAFTKFGRSRGALAVYVADADGAYPIRYESGPDLIKTRFTHTFGARGEFFTSHEYGHAFHWKAIEAPAKSECPDPHFVSGAYTLSCAFVEGFADFFGVWIAGDSLTTESVLSDYAIETNSYRSLGDGSRIEGAVAAFFYDLVDGTIERDNASNTGKLSESTWDQVTYPASYLAQVMQTCQLRIGSLLSYSRLDGVDQFVYCAERSLSAQSLSQYFPTRDVTYDAFSEGATEPLSWSSADIRRLWQVDLYNAVIMVPFP